MPENLDKRVAQARFAAAVRWGNADRDDRERDLVEARITDYVIKLISEAPRLRSDQIDRIVARLRSGGKDE